MTVASKILNSVLIGLSHVFFKIEDSDLERIPMKGPLILVCNHINTYDAPLLIPRMATRPMITLAKVESWSHPLHGILFRIWGGIPIRRGEADMEAFRMAQEAVIGGNMLAVMPEGTRSNTGCLQQGKPGVVLITLRTAAPILPVAISGNENFYRNLGRLRRTPFKIHVGNPFHLNGRGKALSRDVRQQMTDEIMYQVAAILPPTYRGYYSDLSKASTEYLDFAPGIQSNLI
jgi:1-acyl-sn-glycerol-3-phosphate acyltransferase